MSVSNSIDNLFNRICHTDDVIYNQASGGSATMKRNGGDMRDELGYIPPPNRKLPPVPGTQYNTCDRIKRGNYTIWPSSLFDIFPYFLLSRYYSIHLLLLRSSNRSAMDFSQCTSSLIVFTNTEKRAETLVDETLILPYGRRVCDVPRQVVMV